MIPEKTVKYYLQAFKKLDEQKPINTWNWSAFLFGESWLLFRKMNMVGCLLLLFYIVFIFGAIHFSEIFLQSVDKAEIGKIVLILFVVLFIIVRIFLSVFGNKIYYENVKNKIKQGYHTCSGYIGYNYVIVAIFLMMLFALGQSSGYYKVLVIFVTFSIYFIMCSILQWLFDMRRVKNSIKYSFRNFNQDISEDNINAIIANRAEIK